MIKKSTEWIFLNSEKYSDYVKNTGKTRYCVAEFKSEYVSSQKTKIRICADSTYILYINGKYMGRGPVSAGGDFLEPKMVYSYYDEYEICATGRVEISVQVANLPSVLCENAFGYAGLYLQVYEGDKLIHKTDSSWRVRPLSECVDVLLTDYTREQIPFENAEYIPDVHSLLPSEIRHLTEERIYPVKFEPFTVDYQKSRILWLEFDKIYSAMPVISVCSEGKFELIITSSENGEAGIIREKIIGKGNIEHSCRRMRSIGEMTVEVRSLDECEVTLNDVHINYIHYPIDKISPLEVSDGLIKQIYDICIHTLSICRQSIHLDSPTHQEWLACTGDYYIQALMEYYNMYDPSLTRFDILRTAQLLEIQNGRLFHTSYSLIYPMWIYDYIMHTGDRELIFRLEKSLKLLKDRFEGYEAEDNGLIEYAPDYMFVDWVVASDAEDAFLDGGKMMSHKKMEGYSLHHPPKSLGQSVICMLYCKSLTVMEKLFSMLNDVKTATECAKKAKKIKEAINRHLYDKEKGLYIGGLNTPDRVVTGQWLPENNEVKYYLKQANILAVLYGIAPKERCVDILTYVVTDLSKYEMQPNFYHFLLEALYNEGLFEKYGLPIIRTYESLINRCHKGLSEAWENMICDMSHAWGGTPAYILKKALSGFEIIEAGCKKVKLCPNLYGLDSAHLFIPTPYGDIEISMKKGEDVSIKAPEEIEII